MDHVVLVQQGDEGFLAYCSCGWRDEWHHWKHFALAACDKHEKDARELRLNTGSRPTLENTIKQYRQKADNPAYTLAERRQWKMLADDLESQIVARRRTGPVDGQIALPLD